jgi:hypothetical protein
MSIFNKIKDAFSAEQLNGPGLEQALQEHRRAAAEQRAAQSSQVVALLRDNAGEDGLVDRDFSLQAHHAEFDSPDTNLQQAEQIPNQRTSRENKILTSVH